MQMVTCSHEIQRHLLLGRKAMTNLDSILKSRDITFPTKVCLVKVIVFPVVMYGCESWTIGKAEHCRINTFKLWCWRRLLRVSWTLLKLMSMELVMLSNHLIFCQPLFLLPLIFPNIRVFSNELALHIRWPKYQSSSFSTSPYKEYSGLISFRIDWFDLLEVQGILKSSQPSQFKSSNSSVLSLLYGSTFISVHDYWKNRSFDYTDLCWQSDVSAFEYVVQVCHSFPSKEQVSFNFKAVVTICSDFEAKGRKKAKI